VNVMAAEWIVRLLGVYSGVGLVFAAVYLAIGIGRVDPAARGVSLRFRLLITPGCVALWPYLAARWVRAMRKEVAP